MSGRAPHFFAQRNRAWRAVMTPILREGRGSVLGPDTARRARWWEMRLSCNHVVERFVRYRPLPPDERQHGGTQHRSRADVLPAPKQVVCDWCEAQERGRVDITGAAR